MYGMRECLRISISCVGNCENTNMTSNVSIFIRLESMEADVPKFKGYRNPDKLNK
jgi:hypothetical protein